MGWDGIYQADKLPKPLKAQPSLELSELISSQAHRAIGHFYKKMPIAQNFSSSPNFNSRGNVINDQGLAII